MQIIYLKYEKIDKQLLEIRYGDNAAWNVEFAYDIDYNEENA